MTSAYDTLDERGLIENVTDEAAVRKMLANPPVTFYVGFDPTADSLHVGHLLPIMAMAHLQRAGHRPIAVVGGGTGMVGDPSGKTELRNLLTREQINANLEAQKKQLRSFLKFDTDADSAALMVNNADWLEPLNYIEFLRDIGVHFTVNRMLAAECFKQRWEKGLTFIEFNYMLLQAYDFLTLFQRESCTLQVGGNDQWGNILAGCDLTRRVGQDRERSSVALAREDHAVRFLSVLAERRRSGRREMSPHADLPSDGRGPLARIRRARPRAERIEEAPRVRGHGARAWRGGGEEGRGRRCGALWRRGRGRRRHPDARTQHLDT